MGGNIRDNVVSLVKNNVVVGNNKAATGTDWPTSDATATYGTGTTDLWGTTWTTTDINNANFGVVLSVTGTTSNDETARVDNITITVTYSPPHTITATAGAGGIIAPSGATSVTDGANQVFNSEPNSGNILSGVSIDGGASVGALNVYTFNNVLADHTIAATFENGWSASSNSIDGDFDVTGDGNTVASNDSYAVFNNPNDEADFRLFGLSIPNGATIQGIQVAVEGNRDSNRTIDLALSWDDGANFTATKTLSTFTGTDSTLIAGGTADTWGHSWTPAQVNNSNLRLRVEGNGGSNDVNLDQIQVKVTYTTDSVAPTVSTVDSDGDTYNIASAATQPIMVTFSEDISNTPTIAVSGDAQTVTNCADADAKTFCFNYSVPAATDATTKTVQISGAQDSSTNVMVADNSHTFVVDTEAPVIAFTTTIPSLTNNPMPSFTYSTDEDGTVNLSGTSCNHGVGSQTVATTAQSPNVPLVLNTLSSGSYTCSVSATDAAGNVSNSLVSAFTVDVTNPTVTVGSGASDPTNDGTIPVSVFFNEAVTGFDLSDATASVTNGTAQDFVATDAQNYSFNVVPASDGVTISVTVPSSAASDAAGNGNATSNTITRAYDTTAPSVTIDSGPSISPASPYTNDTTPTFTFSMTGGTSLLCAQDGGAFGACSGDPTSHTFAPALSDGPRTFSVKAIDAAFNESTATASFNVDTVLPVPSFSAPSVIGGFASSSPVAVTVTFTEAVTDFIASDVMVTGGAVVGSFSGSGTTYTFDLNVSPDGPVVVDIPAGFANEANGSGNTSAAASANLSFTLDSTDPVVAFTNGPSDGSSTSSTNVQFDFTITDANSTTDSCSFDGVGTTTPCTSPQVFSGLTDGVHTFWLTSVDVAGNSTTTTTTFTVNTTPATLTAPTANPGSGSYSETQTVTLSADPGTSIYYTSNDNNQPECPSTGTLYTGPITVPTNVNIKTIACMGAATSTVATFIYTIATPPSNTGGGGGGNGPIVGSTGGGGQVLGASTSTVTTNTNTTPPATNPTTETGNTTNTGNTTDTGGAGGSTASNAGATQVASTGSNEVESTGSVSVTTEEADATSTPAVSATTSDNKAQAAAAFLGLDWWWILLLILIALGLGYWAWSKYYQK